MATMIGMPNLGHTMEKGTVAQWLKREGEAVARDEPLVEVESDKVAFTVEAPASGVLLRIVAPAGVEVAVGKAIGYLGEPGERIAESEAAPARASGPVPDAPVARLQSELIPPPAREPSMVRPRITPLARRLAEEHGLSLEQLVGTGPAGSVTREDVLAALARREAKGAKREPQPGRTTPAAPRRPSERLPQTGMLDTLAQPTDLNRDRLIELYRQMVTIRMFEEGVWKVYSQGLMPGLAHLYTGQEAIAVGVCAALRADDYITSTHRGHGHCIAKGGKVDRMMAELMGKVTGYCRGKGGSMHIADPDLGILGANGIVGGSFGIATGAGLSARMLALDRVVVCFFGDGAANEGIFHEAINIAAIWNLPVIYVCENNLYGMTVAQSRAMRLERIADRAAAYGIVGATVNGNDVLAVYEASKLAVQRARQGDGPSLLECTSYRWYGHHVGDPGTAYRTAEEVDAWKANCPIKRFRTWLIEQGYLDEAEARAIQADREREIEEAIDFGKSSPFPPGAELTTDVFSSVDRER